MELHFLTFAIYRQNGGLFVIEGGDRVLFEHVEATAGDHPDLKQVLTACGADENLMNEYQRTYRTQGV
jgi:hypothetical protein